MSTPIHDAPTSTEFDWDLHYQAVNQQWHWGLFLAAAAFLLGVGIYWSAWAPAFTRRDCAVAVGAISTVLSFLWLRRRDAYRRRALQFAQRQVCHE